MNDTSQVIRQSLLIAWTFFFGLTGSANGHLFQDDVSRSTAEPVNPLVVTENIVFQKKLGVVKTASVNLGDLNCGKEVRVNVKIEGPLSFAKVRTGCRCKLLKIDKLHIEEGETADATFSFKTPLRSKQQENLINYSFVASDNSVLANLKIYYSLKGNLSLDRTNIDLNTIEGVEEDLTSKVPFVYSAPATKQSLECSVLGKASLFSAELTFTEHTGHGILVVTGKASEDTKFDSAIVRVRDRETGASHDLSVKLRRISPIVIRPRLLRLNWSEQHGDFRCQFLVKTYWEYDQDEPIAITFQDAKLKIETQKKSPDLLWVLLSINEEKLDGQTGGLFSLTANHTNGKTSRNIKWSLPAK